MQWGPSPNEMDVGKDRCLLVVKDEGGELRWRPRYIEGEADSILPGGVQPAKFLWVNNVLQFAMRIEGW